MFKSILYTVLGFSLLSVPAIAGWDDVFDNDWDGNGRLYNNYSCRSSYSGIPSFRGSDRRGGGGCKRFKNPAQKEACQLAKKAAMAGAVFRIRPKAIHDGLTEGFDCGIDAGIQLGNSDYNYRRSLNDLSVRHENEILKDSNGTMRNEVQYPAESSGQNMAANEVVSRFRRAVTENGGSLPSRDAGNPSHGFQGVPNGYNLNGHYVQDADDILDDIYANSYLDMSAFYDSRYDREYGWGAERNRYSYGKKRRRKGRHGYSDGGDGYNRIWMKIVRSGNKPRRLKRLVRQWRQLSDEPIIKKKKVEFQPPAGEDGVLPPKETRVETTELPSPKKVFSRRFGKLWKHSLHRAYYRIFERYLDRGFDMALPAGERAGQIYAEQRGQRDAYDNLFADESIVMFGNYFRPAYQTAFGQNYSTYESASHIEGLSWNLIGAVNDGALMQGEKASFNFTLTNIGGKAKNNFQVMAQEILNSEAAGSAGASAQDYDVKALQRKAFSTESFFVLPDNAISMSERKTSISVRMQAAGKASSQRLTIFKPAGFENSNASTSLQQAELYLPVTIYNPKNITSVEDVKVRMIMNGQVVEEKSLGMLPAGEQQLTFVMAQDFFDMIGKTYSFKVELDYGSETIQARENINVSINKKAALVEYFDYMVLQKSAKLPSGVKYSDYLAQYINAVSDVYKEEILSVAAEFAKADDRKARTRVKKSNKPDFELDRKDRYESSQPSIMLQIYNKRPYNDKSRDLKKKLDSNTKAALVKLAQKNLIMIRAEYLKLGQDDRHKRDYFGNTICGTAQVLYAFMHNKRRKDAQVIEINVKKGKRKDKFKCTVD